MKLTFKRSSQDEADKLRKLLEETIEVVKVRTVDHQREIQPFNIEAGAEFVEKDESSMYGRKIEKEWRYTVTLETASCADGSTSDSSRWKALFEKLIQRPAIGRGTIVKIGQILSPELVKFLRGDAIEPEAVEQKFVDYLMKSAARGYYADSEGRVVKATQIAYTLDMSGEMDTTAELLVDAVDAPIADAVLDTTIDDIERDMVRAAEAKVREAAKAVKS